jgi:hypothetical protein
MSLEKTSIGEMSFDKMSFDQMSFDQMSFDQTSIDKKPMTHHLQKYWQLKQEHQWTQPACLVRLPA